MKLKEPPRILSIFDEQAPEREAQLAPQKLTIVNYGKDITINITPADFVDNIKYSSVMELSNVDGYRKVRYDDNYPDTVFSILGKNVVEIAEIEPADLETRGFDNHADFAAKFFDPLVVQNVLLEIMDLGRANTENSDDKTAQTAETIKN